jgi:outer membrane protein assembly factor BamB/actin-like ATPase involved in cell morphogenesis
MNDWYLGIDYGTTSSAAAVVDPRGLFHLEVEGHRRLSSMVLRDDDGSLLVGGAAENQAAIYPDRIELTPKRHLGRGVPLLLGGSPVSVTDAVAQVLRALALEAGRQHSGRPPRRIAITHPVRWEERRKQELRDAAAAAGIVDPVLLEEPVAAAITYLDDRIPEGGLVAVYDLGGGTFDTAVLRRTGDWFEVVGAPGGDETIGGEDFDHRVVRFFTEALRSIDAEAFEQLAVSEDRRWRRAAADLKAQSRRAKEALSSYPTAQVFVSVVDADLRITRREFEAMISDDVDLTIEELEATIDAAGVEVSDLSAVYLVGGSARIPLVAERMSVRFGSLVTTRDDPKTVTALGAARHAERVGTGQAPAVAGPATTTATVTVPEAAPPAPDAAPPAPPLPPVPDAGATVVVRAGDFAAALDAAAQAHQPAVQHQVPQASWGGAWTAQAPVAPAGPFEAPPPGNVAEHRRRLRWDVSMGQPLTSAPVVIGDLVIAGTFDGRVTALHLADGSVRWSVTASAPVLDSVAVDGGGVYFCTRDGVVAAVGAEDGSFRWWSRVGGAVQGAGVAVGGWFWVGSTDEHTYAFNAATGQVVWRYRVGKPVESGLAVGGTCIYFGDANRSIHGVDAASGQPVWRVRTRGIVIAKPVYDDGVVFVGSEDQIFRALDATTGAIRWQVNLGGAIRTAAAIGPDVVVVLDKEGVLHALDRHTGSHRWWMRFGQRIWASPLISGNTINLPGPSGAVYGLSLVDGSEQWWAPMGGWSTSPPALAADGALVVESNDGRLRCIEPQ